MEQQKSVTARSLDYCHAFCVTNTLLILLVLYTGGSITENVDMSLYAFSSFHVRHRYKSAVPAVAFTLGMRNKADRPLNVSFMFNLPLGQQEDTIRVGDNYGEVVFTRYVIERWSQLSSKFFLIVIHSVSFLLIYPPEKSSSLEACSCECFFSF